MKIDKEKLLFGIYVICITLFVYLRNVIQINISAVIITALTTIYLIISKKHPFELLAFLIPFNSAVQTNYIICRSCGLYNF